MSPLLDQLSYEPTCARKSTAAREFGKDSARPPPAYGGGQSRRTCAALRATGSAVTARRRALEPRAHARPLCLPGRKRLWSQGALADAGPDPVVPPSSKPSRPSDCPSTTPSSGATVPSHAEDR